MRRTIYILLVITIYAANALSANGEIGYCYWFDGNVDGSYRGQLSEGANQLSIDVATLSSGIHTLNVVVLNEDGQYGCPVSALFLKVDYTSVWDNARLITMVDGMQVAEQTANSGFSEYRLPIDVSDFEIGLHTIQAWIESDASTSPAYSSLFLRVPKDIEKEKLTCYYGFDEFTTGFREVMRSENGLYQFQADVTGEDFSPDEEHMIHCIFVTDYGTVSHIFSAPFEKTVVTEPKKCPIAMCSYNGRFVTLTSALPDAQIHFTIDGEDPTGESAIYDAPFDTHGLANIKAIVTKTQYEDSDILTYRTPLYFDGITAWIEDAQALERGLMSDYSSFAAIVWSATEPIPESLVEQIDNNNLLVFVETPELAPSNAHNVVVDGYAENIALSDSGGRSDFFSPASFRAGSISYSRNFSQRTPIGGSSGWETITLPFDVQRVMRQNQEIRPFAQLRSSDYTNYKPFWLMEIGDRGFVSSSRITANVPYVISMPNNAEYAEPYILSGDIIFESEDVEIPATKRVRVDNGDREFVGTTALVGAADTVYALNLHMPYESYAEGAVFVSSLRNVRPFEAYMTTSEAVRAPIRISDMMDDAEIGAIDAVKSDELWGVYAIDGVLYITTGISQHIEVITLSGVVIYSEMIEPGVTGIYNLPQGVYIVKDTKVMIR